MEVEGRQVEHVAGLLHDLVARHACEPRELAPRRGLRPVDLGVPPRRVVLGQQVHVAAALRGVDEDVAPPPVELADHVARAVPVRLGDHAAHAEAAVDAALARRLLEEDRLAAARVEEGQLVEDPLRARVAARHGREPEVEALRAPVLGRRVEADRARARGPVGPAQVDVLDRARPARRRAARRVHEVVRPVVGGAARVRRLALVLRVAAELLLEVRLVGPARGRRVDLGVVEELERHLRVAVRDRLVELGRRVEPAERAVHALRQVRHVVRVPVRDDVGDRHRLGVARLGRPRAVRVAVRAVGQERVEIERERARPPARDLVLRPRRRRVERRARFVPPARRREHRQQDETNPHVLEWGAARVRAEGEARIPADPSRV